MCNVAANLLASMEKTVRQFLDEGRMFTGYDVTLETREREKVNLKHRDCRGVVHEMTFLNDAIEFGYDPDPKSNAQTVKWAKTQVDMGNGTWAFVYHPSNVDPNSYTARHGQAPAQHSSVVLAPTSPVVTAAPATDDSTVNDSGGENSDGTFETDYRNRLMVKTKFVRAINLNPGDDVVVVCDSNKQTITLLHDMAAAPQPGNGIGVATQRVERNGDFRLSSATLRSAGLSSSKFKVEISQVPAASGIGSNIVEIFAA